MQQVGARALERTPRRKQRCAPTENIVTGPLDFRALLLSASEHNLEPSRAAWASGQQAPTPFYCSTVAEAGAVVDAKDRLLAQWREEAQLVRPRCIKWGRGGMA
jgi:hypothetical protein